MPFFYGRGLFQLDFGFFPHRTPIDTVVGAPIAVPKIPQPTEEEVDRVHRQYCEPLQSSSISTKLDSASLKKRNSFLV
ncbi:hypothetical protein COOONC_22983 [Cooperia oncophora]